MTGHPLTFPPVGIKFLMHSCNQCLYCLQGDEILCPNRKVAGRDVAGTFQQ